MVVAVGLQTRDCIGCEYVRGQKNEGEFMGFWLDGGAIY